MSPANWCAYGAVSAGWNVRPSTAKSAVSNIRLPMAVASDVNDHGAPRATPGWRAWNAANHWSSNGFIAGSPTPVSAPVAGMCIA